MGERFAPCRPTQHELVISQPNLQALRAEVHKLQGRNKELSAFSRTVAHDLKSPLGTMVCLASVLHEGLAELSVEEQQKYLGDLVRVARKMSNIVDELLLLAEVSDAKVVVHPLDMATIVAAAQERLVHMTQDYQAEITLPAAWTAAEGYEPWIEEVWVNYLSNAIKYGGTPPLIELGSELQADGMVRFWVHDNGAGIAPAAQAQLFKPFTRLSSIRAGGHGLGLSVVLDIVTKLGGQVGVTSAPGRGSTFSFTLPGKSP
jgi:signal transduction histidine kinase